MKLSSCYNDRQRQLDALRAEITKVGRAEVDDLRKRALAREEQMARDTEAAIAAAASVRRSLHAALVEACQKTLAPLVADLRVNPTRPVAVAIGAQLVALIAREHEELGKRNRDPRAITALRMVMVDALIVESPSAVNLFGCADSPYGVAECVGAVAKNLASPPQLMAAIVDLETCLTALAVGQTRTPEDRAVKRWQILRTMDEDALAAFDDLHDPIGMNIKRPRLEAAANT